MSKHYTKEDLELYRHGEMSILNRIQCKAHLNTCRECQDRLEELDADDLLIKELRSSVRLFDELSKTKPEDEKKST